MSIVRKIKRTLRGEVAPTAAALELLRRSRVRLDRRRERSRLSKLQERAAKLQSTYAAMSGTELLDHFRTRSQPVFLPGFSIDAGAAQAKLFPEETQKLISDAQRIAETHSWPLLGIGELNFGEQIDWHRDPLSQFHWPLEYYADLNLFRNDGSDARVLWELNRLAHFITLARAYAVTRDEIFAREFFAQLESWYSQNPYGRGVNWTCAMEVALRATNLLAAFEIFRHSSELDEQKLALMLAMFDQHGTFIREHLEFSHIATSNHYLSDVVGLVWLGMMLPELEPATEWREFGLREVRREMDKQVLADGADFESSTGYHRFVLELFLYTFILCRANKFDVEDKYWQKLQQMLYYLRAYLRPDGRAPLIGDSDSGQFLPITKRAGDDHAYLLPLGATVFRDSDLKDPRFDETPELLWILGEEGVDSYDELTASRSWPESAAFADAGVYIMRREDEYLLLNASGAGINGRGSHGHNDALAIEVSACGRAFIVDPGTYVYSANLDERHRFRSTAHHSTVEIDGVEQNTTQKDLPFVIGDEAKPKVVKWERGADEDIVSAEHYGYTNLKDPVTHRRTVKFDKQGHHWLITDEFLGTGNHEFAVRFHFAAGLNIQVVDNDMVRAEDSNGKISLTVIGLNARTSPQLETQFLSCDYLSKSERTVACWRIQATAPAVFHWAIVPVCAGEDLQQRLSAVVAMIS